MCMISKALTGVALTRDQIRNNPFQARPREFLSILEFIPGYSLVEADGSFKGFQPEQLEKLGRVCALDVWINHSERFDLPMWRSGTFCLPVGRGSPDSIMVPGGAIVALDQRVKLIPEGLDRTKHFAEVRILLEGDNWTDDSRRGMCDAIASVLPLDCGEASPEQLDHISKGLSQGFGTIARLSKEGSLGTYLEKAKKTIRRTFQAATQEVGRTELDDFLNFVESAAQTIEESLLRDSSFAASTRSLCGASCSSRPLSDSCRS